VIVNLHNHGLDCRPGELLDDRSAAIHPARWRVHI